ncbi:7-alpha-hydroxycholest-4-en-3-one 12-alpha-hydroxylase-like [Eleutherodactylus coqui]|uniref:5-beta-cholestane-3-alpha,7-alpha-diol 12-alpha-hydroxylase n=1 Tax=Eleutherodactylus coqui TaxID=57060 RepID=A0A8J6KJY2_ELECQ|nr:hypothetical protein GDO78_002168 [Eleutherodactylus coqui]
MLLAILLALLALVFGGLYMLGVFRKRRPNEPPLEKGTIPWLGYGIEFRKNTYAFLEKMQKKHGDIFTVQLAGYYITFITDPLSFGSIVKEFRAKLDFDDFAIHLVARVFGYHSRTDDHKLLEKASKKHLKGDGLVVITKAMMKNLQNLMLHNIGDGQKKWQQDGLFHYSYNIVFRAGYLALFGNEPAKNQESLKKAKKFDQDHSDELFGEFRKYDKLFPRLAYAVLPPKDKMEAERLKRLFWTMLSVKRTLQKENISGWITDQSQYKAENGMPEYMQDRFMFLLLWASQGNTGPACFWLLLYLMKHPDAIEAVRGEVENVLKETGQQVKAGGPLINLTRDMLLKTPIMDSAIEETLRLTAAPMLTRSVKDDMILKMSNGKKYAIRQGDLIALFPYTALHMDQDIYPEPKKFKYNRFLKKDGTKKTDFFKNGKLLKFFTMPWGAGTTICPGRFFAVNEVKQFIFLMLSYFEFKLVNPKEEIPGIDQNRWGFGIMQPTHDIQFKYRLR